MQVAVVLLSDAVAVIIILPADTPVTRPEEETVATDESDDDHVTCWLAVEGATEAVS